MVDVLKKKQTITSTALRFIGTFHPVRAENFFWIFFPYSWNGQWNDRPLGSFHMNSPLETFVREVISDNSVISDKNNNSG